MYDVIIIGAGPAGLTAAIYCCRQGLDTVVFEKLISGGQMALTRDISNFPGYGQVMGFDLTVKFEDHARSLGAHFKNEEVLRIEEGKPIKVHCAGVVYEAKCVIFCAGAKKRGLGVKGEERLTGRGVSYCATCDGGFFRNKTAAVIGGGNTALEEVMYLSGICKKVYLIHHNDKFDGDKLIMDNVNNLKNVEILTYYSVEEIVGEDALTSVKLKNENSGEIRELELDGLFIAVGTVPNTEILGDCIEFDERGYVDIGEDCRTCIPGLFVAGDSRKKPLKQIITAASDGAVAASEAGKYLKNEYKPG